MWVPLEIRIDPGDNSKSPLVLMPVFEYVKEYYKNSIDKEYYSFSDWLEEALDVKFQNKSQILKVTYKSNDNTLLIA